MSRRGLKWAVVAASLLRPLLVHRQARGTAMVLRVSAAVLLIPSAWPRALAQEKQADDRAKELARLEGHWQIVSLAVSQTSLRFDAGGGGSFTFTGARSRPGCRGSVRRRARWFS